MFHKAAGGTQTGKFMNKRHKSTIPKKFESVKAESQQQNIPPLTQENCQIDVDVTNNNNKIDDYHGRSLERLEENGKDDSNSPTPNNITRL